MVRSRITPRSNSARAAKMWNTSLPPAVVVSIASVSERRPMPRVAELLDGLDQLLERAGQAVELPDHQRVALAHVLERRL